MKNEKSRGTMLVSSAVILCAVTFVAGLPDGNMVAEHWAVSRSVTAASAPAPAPEAAPAAPASTNASTAEAQAQHIGHLRDEARQNPDSADAWTKLGNACFDAGDADGAIEAYQESLRLEPGNADVRTDMGSMYRMKGEPARAWNATIRRSRIIPASGTPYSTRA